MDGGGKIRSGPVTTGCDGAEPLELAEKILEQVSSPVRVLVIKMHVRAIVFRRYDRGVAPG